ncbi:MAG: acyltransferase family protein [Planctomycetes bacterium]|nr:acyltransferase family protein [Planctomycetota bacterium]
MDRRIPWVDVCRGLGILLVVAGHTDNRLKPLIYWFHMPLFFFLSGFLFSGRQPVVAFARRKAGQLLVPYVVLVFALTAFQVIGVVATGPPGERTATIGRMFGHALFGGQMLDGIFVVYWFFTCLFLTQMLFNVLCHYVPPRTWWWVGVLGLCYLTAWADGRWAADVPFPWAADVTLMAVVFFALGHVFRRQGDRSTIPVGVVAACALIAAVAVYCRSRQWFDFDYDMIAKAYGLPGVNLVVPVALIVLTIRVSMWLSRVEPVRYVLAEMGRASMVIMALHLLVMRLVLDRLDIDGFPPWLTVPGMLVPYLVFRWLQRFPALRPYGFGRTPSNSA